MAPGGLCVQPSVVSGKTYWIAPFGNLRINVYLPLPEACRSLSRPSSPDGAKASVVRPYTLSRKVLIKNIKTFPLGLRCILPRNIQLSKIDQNPLKSAVKQWWACLESNQGPRPYQGRALTN